MRILLVNYEYPPVGGGAATASEAIAKQLVKLGHSVVVVTGRYDGLPARAEANGIVLRRIPSLRKAIDRSGILEMFSFLVSGLFFIWTIIRRDRIEKAIVFFSFPCGPIGLLGRWLCGVPYVISLRGGDVPRNEPSLSFIHSILRPLRRAILKNSIANVANSDGLRRMAEAADPFPVQVIPNGVDPEMFSPPKAEPGKDQNVLRILFVGRFQKQKNLPLLLQQVAQLPQNIFELHVVGDGPEREHLKDLAQQLGISSAIRWRAWVRREDLPAIYRSVDLLVSPSLYEGMSNVVLEAMACGLPVIASKVPGNEALILDGQTGLLFDLKEPDGLLAALRALMGNRQLAQDFGAAGRQRAQSEFSWRAVAESYLQLLER